MQMKIMILMIITATVFELMTEMITITIMTVIMIMMVKY